VTTRERRTWHIVTCEYPPAVGGVSDYTRRMARSLADEGDEVHVWCPGSTLREDDGAGVTVHARLGALTPADLRRVGTQLDRFPVPRRVLVQWVPHGFGYYSMNIWFCAWLAARAWSGDRVELMVHEPFLVFRRGPARYLVVAIVHRLMTLILLATSHRVWVAIPAWERALRPYALGRRLRMDWLPIPSCTLPRPAGSGPVIRSDGRERPVVGHFGSFGPPVVEMLEERLGLLLEQDPEPFVHLIGMGSEACRDAFIHRHPTWAGRVLATGYVDASGLGRCLEACDLFVQPYPDGITSRRTSAMACLSSGRPVVTTCGDLTEPLWAETRAVAMADANDVAAFVSIVTNMLTSDERRRELGERGLRLCEERFSFSGVVAALRAA